MGTEEHGGHPLIFFFDKERGMQNNLEMILRKKVSGKNEVCP